MRQHIIFGVSLLACSWLASCKQELIKDPAQYTRVYMPQAVNYPATQNLVMTDTIQSISFGAAYGGVNDLAAALQVRFRVNPALTDSFNKKNGTAYFKMPEAGFALSDTTATIAPGGFNTKTLALNIKTVGGIEPLKDYLLPVTIEQASPGITVNENLRTTYFLIRGTYAEFNRAAWKVSVSTEEAPNVGVNAFDGDLNTQWHTQWKTAQPKPPHQVQVDMNEVKTIHGFYHWPVNKTTGNASNITIQLSMDGVSWNNAGSFTFNNVYEKQTYYLPAAMQARYFRVIVTATFTNTTHTHIAEIGAF